MDASPSSSSSSLPISFHTLDPSPPQLLQELAVLSVTRTPLLPIELHHHILRFCDIQSLVKTSLVSLAFLHLSAPLLYRDVEVHGYEQLTKLFCSRLSSQPQLEPHLSLHHIRTFTFTLAKQDHLVYHFSMDRLPGGSQPLAVDKVTVRTSTHSSLPLHLFNPSVASFEALPPSNAEPTNPEDPLVESSTLHHLSWPRLNELLLRDCRVFVGPYRRLASLCSTDVQASQLRVSFELTRPRREVLGSHLREWMVVEVYNTLAFERHGLNGPGDWSVKEVVFRVEEKQMEWAKYMLRGSRSAADPEKLSEKLRFEVWQG